MTGRY